MCIDNPIDAEQECLQCEEYPEKCIGKLPGKLRSINCIKYKED